MPLSKENRDLLKLGEFFIANTWRCLLRSLWLFFPAILFIALAYFMFWVLPQGKDLMVITIENPKGRNSFMEFFCFIIALLFWVYVTWYSTRIVARAKYFQEPDNPDNKDSIWEIFRVQSPRILAFTCITVILLALFQLGSYGYPSLSFKACNWLLLFSYGWFFLLYKMCQRIVRRGKRTKQQWGAFLKRFRKGIFIMLALFGVLMMALKSFASVVITLIVLQACLLLLMIVRRELDEATLDEETENPEGIVPESGFWKKMKYIVLHDENRNYIRLFMIFSTIGVCFYLAAIIWIRFAVFIGPFPFVLLAFGVLLGFGNIITYFSVLKRFNFHLLAFVVALIFGGCFDSHKLSLPDNDGRPKFSERKSLDEFFTDWINEPERKKILGSGDSSKYPVYFVMANGGASRSGYWTAQVLSQLEDKSNGDFSKHLFCLSGASGGSVGNATFFSLLRARDRLSADSISFTGASAEYLKSDFLTFTISHLLGPDIFRNIFPPLNKLEMDRGRALAFSLEKAPNKNAFLYDSFAVKFTSLITQKGKKYNLPVLCINATLMRDGSPAVFSNILIDGTSDENSYFNKRIDILSKVGDGSDIKLSTAVSLGASFPYISPAGRIDNDALITDKKGRLKSAIDAKYFVDGGYFDNSGAGVVNEMIFAINNMMGKVDSLKKYKDRIEFHVLHIMNTDPKESDIAPVNSMTNDLLAPVKTMIGSYGKQTSINDQRLKTYLYSLYGNNEHYREIDLYDHKPSDFIYSMNWVFSERQRNKMDSALQRNETFRNEVKKWKTGK